MISKMVRSVCAMPGLLIRPILRMAPSGVAWHMPSFGTSTVPSTARQALIRAAPRAVASFTCRAVLPVGEYSVRAVLTILAWVFRIVLAKDCLIHTDKQMAQEAGYANLSNFTRRFKSSENMTPGQYRYLYGDGKKI